MDIQAADGDGYAVTAITFWDGPAGELAPYDYYNTIDFENCECCLVAPPVDVSWF